MTTWTRSRHNIKAGSSRVIARATMASMLGLMLAKITGFLREILIIPKLGYGVYSDAYNVGFLIPDLLYELLLGGAVAAAIMPTLSSGIERDRQRQAWDAVNIFISIFISAVVVVMGMTALLMPVLIKLMNPNKDPQVIAAAIPVSRVLLLQCIVMMLVGLLNGILNAYKRFGWPAFGTTIYNLAYIAALIKFGAPSSQGLRSVAFGVVGAAGVYLCYLLVLARRELSRLRFDLNYRHPGFKRLLRLALPTLLSGSVLHLNTIIMNSFANQFVGAPTTLRQANTTWALPYGVLAVAIGGVMLPNLTGFFAKRDFYRVRTLYTDSLRKALYYIAPFAIGFAVYNFQTVQAIFQWNRETYTDEQVAVTGSVLIWFCVSMLAQTVVYLTNCAFFARKVTKLALFIGVVSLVLNPIFCLLYVKLFQFGIVGIAMAHASYSVVSALLLFALYKHHIPEARPYKILPFIFRIAICCFVAGVVSLALAMLGLRPSSKFVQLLVYVLQMSVTFFAYYVTGIAIELREAKALQHKLFSLLGRAYVLGR